MKKLRCIVSFNKGICFQLACILYLIYGCKKASNTKETGEQYFIHDYSFSQPQEAYNFYPSGDNGYLLLGYQSDPTSTIEQITIIKTSANGLLMAHKNIEVNGFGGMNISYQKEQGILISPSWGASGSYILKLDNNGNEVFKKPFNSNPLAITYFSFPTINENKKIAFASSTKFGVYFGDFFTFNQDGDFIKTVPIDAGGLFSTSEFNCLYKYQDSATFYYYGIGSKLGVNSPIAHLFVAKQVNGKLIKCLWADTNNLSFKNQAVSHIMMPNGQLMIYSQQYETNGYFTGYYKGYFAVIDENLNKVWELDLKLGANSTWPNAVNICPDGNYLITGACKIDNNLLWQPFACKINSQGKIIWSKIYNTARMGYFVSGMQLANGNFVFEGTTNSFGKGKNLTDIFLVKTDANGNLR